MALMIDENYDLKELEKLDFEEYDSYWFYYCFTKANNWSEVRYYINKSDRTIEIQMDNQANGCLALDKAYELFKLGIVREV